MKLSRSAYSTSEIGNFQQEKSDILFYISYNKAEVTKVESKLQFLKSIAIRFDRK
jgi:hypothetical protein